MAVQEEKAVAPVMEEELLVLVLTETEVLDGVVALYVSVPHAAPAVNSVSKIDEVKVPEGPTVYASSEAKVFKVSASYKSEADTLNTFASEEAYTVGPSGTLTSSIFDTEFTAGAAWGTLTYNATTPSNTSVSVKT